MSDSRGFEPKGGRVNGLGALTPRARSLATRLSTDRVPFARLLAVNRTLYKETVTLEVSVEVPQLRNYDIRPRERVSVEFQPAGDSEPMVWALRHDFPPVPHAYRLRSRAACCLCLYEDKLSWTPERFVSRLREWLAQAATGELLNPDLPMEPLLGVFRTVVVPPKLLSEPKAAKLKMFRHESGSVWQVRYESDAPVTTTPRPIDCLGITVRSDTQTQSVSESRPITFGGLVRMLHRFGIDILAELRSKLARVRIGTNLREPRILLVVDIPKRRYEDSEPESTDIFAFLLQENRFSYLMDLLGPADSRCDQAYEAWRPSLEMVTLTCFGAVTELSAVPRTGDSGAAEPGPKCVAVG